MKVFGAVFVAFLAVVPLSAQYWSVGGFGNVVFPGLGHAPSVGNPWGNVVHPATPQGAVVPSSGANVMAANRGGTGHAYRHGNTSSIYAYPVFVGGYGYGYGGYAPAQPDQPAPANAAQGDQPATPPIVINQYFGTPPAGDQPPPEAAASNFHYYQAPANDDPVPADTAYYLIAFKDHTVYSAVAYYTEGDTLHYFTSGNVHNQVSLALVDRKLTEQLNSQRNVAVQLPQPSAGQTVQ
ncbi:MAG: hypothetical protein ABSG65_16750 [Bryobacteraceae bacterium]|jgi:hypothetical protein